ncbi:ankyrin repeat-containing domain protein, partial [Mycena galopus ATCC 62051]
GRALIQSADTGNLEISKYLVAEGADVNFHAEHSGTPLCYATRTTNLDLVHFLLASGADPNIHGESFYIPLLNARNTDVAKALLVAGASLHDKDENGWNAVTVQIADGNLEMLRLFLERGGADVNVHSEHYGTALYCATSTKNPDLELVQFLLASGADPNTHRQPSCVPLLNARNTDVAKALLLAGASLHAKDGNGRNAVTVQIVGANLEMLRFFLERGVDPN